MDLYILSYSSPLTSYSYSLVFLIDHHLFDVFYIFYYLIDHTSFLLRFRRWCRLLLRLNNRFLALVFVIRVNCKFCFQTSEECCTTQELWRADSWLHGWNRRIRCFVFSFSEFVVQVGWLFARWKLAQFSFCGLRWSNFFFLILLTLFGLVMLC